MSTDLDLFLSLLSGRLNENRKKCNLTVVRSPAVRLDADNIAARSRRWRCSANNAEENPDADDATSTRHQQDCRAETYKKISQSGRVDIEGRRCCLLSHDTTANRPPRCRRVPGPRSRISASGVNRISLHLHLCLLHQHATTQHPQYTRQHTSRQVGVQLIAPSQISLCLIYHISALKHA